jgi:hypothetical protein
LSKQRAHGGVFGVKWLDLSVECAGGEGKSAAVADQLGTPRSQARLEQGRALPVTLARELWLAGQPAAATTGIGL